MLQNLHPYNIETIMNTSSFRIWTGCWVQLLNKTRSKGVH